MMVFDAHLDLAWNAIDWNRDLTRSVARIRLSEAGMVEPVRGHNTVSFDAMRQGEVGICIATLLARALRPTLPPIQRYSSMEAAYAAAQGQIAYYHAMCERGILRWIRWAEDLDEHADQWIAGSNSPLGFILSMEGADPILSPDQIGQWWEQGLRVIGPSHYGVSPYSHGTGTEGGLRPGGRTLLEEMQQVGMILDVTHLADQSFWECLDAFGGPVLASHHNCRALVPHQRQLSDDQIRRLLEREAVIGIAFDAWMLYPDWVRGHTDRKVVGLEAVLDHVDHICQLAGNAAHVGIGTDLDGGFGTEQCPRDLDTIADLQKLPAMFAARGYSAQDTAAFMHKNWIRFFQRALPAYNRPDREQNPRH